MGKETTAKGIIRFKEKEKVDDGCDTEFCDDTERQVMSMYKGKDDKWISEKISTLIKEGKSKDQAVAIAYSMAGKSKGEAKKAVMKSMVQSMKAAELAKSESELIESTKRQFCDNPFAKLGRVAVIENPMYSDNATGVDDLVAKSFEVKKSFNGEMLEDPLRKSK